MRSLLPLLILLSYSCSLTAQPFVEISDRFPYEGKFTNSTFDFADIDDDGDQDMVLSGYSSGEPGPILRLYTSDDKGRLTLETNQNFPSLIRGTVDLVDIDNDGDPDLLISGNDYPTAITNGQTYLYRNDGTGQFLPDTTHPFPGVARGVTDFADFDQDGDIDLILSGNTSQNSTTIGYYRNDGSGQFEFFPFAPSSIFITASLSHGDVDNDGDLDLFQTGKDSLYNGTSILYLNDGTGNFTQAPNQNFIGDHTGESVMADLDNDGDIDIFYNGIESGEDTWALLYLNDGTGQFEHQFTAVRKTSSSRFDVADVDSDGDFDILIQGTALVAQSSGAAFVGFTKLYVNDGQGIFSPSVSTIDDLHRGAARFIDANGDGAPDIFSAGIRSGFGAVANWYINDGSGSYRKESGLPNSTTIHAHSIGDTDGDGDNDILIRGALYENDGTGYYTRVSDTPFFGGASGTSALFDLDGDGDLDVLITGKSGAGTVLTRLYRNLGDHQFQALYHDLPPMFSTSIRTGHLNGDDLLDLCILGRKENGQYTTQCFLNDGDSDFTLIDQDLPAFRFWDVVLEDFNADGRSDLMIVGGLSFNDYSTVLYWNQGDGQFVAAVDTPFDVFERGASIAVADVDNNATIDLLISGRDTSGDYTSKLYLSDGSGFFQTAPSLDLPGTRYGSAQFADLDDDGAPDLLLSGEVHANGTGFTQVYRNVGSGSFEVFDTGTDLAPLRGGAARMADLDGDTDLDILVLGSNGEFYETVHHWYRNDRLLTSTSPFRGEPEWRFELFPNPIVSGTSLMIRGDFVQGTVWCRLFDQTGRNWSHQRLESSASDPSLALDLPDLPAGYYFLSIQTATGRGIQPLVIVPQ